jgi:hypothetical protein
LSKNEKKGDESTGFKIVNPQGKNGPSGSKLLNSRLGPIFKLTYVPKEEKK